MIGLLGVVAGGCDGGGSSSGTPGVTNTAGATPSSGVTRAPGATASAVASATAAPTATAVAPVGPIVLYRGDASRRAIALTFDAGSDAGYTTDILRTLRAEGIRASFSVTGLWAEANPELLNSIAADGHVLINHSYSHPSFTGRSTGAPPLTAEERALQLSRVETTVYRLTSRSTRPYFRPPFGDFDASVEADAAAAGFPVIVMWTVDTFGWNGATAEQIIERTMALAGPGAIVIMHVGSESQDAAALPELIRRLRAEGYTFVTIDQMLP
ncbi:MAG TPA: polysaccharide deacetylase family protein [Dehalococcoidia bacterium]|nr:polysaccharide deacetylase family protein [Dehalococcoidia bacterium]